MKYLDKIIEYGFYLLVCLLPWQTRLIIHSGEINGGYNEYLSISLYGVDILLAIIICLFVFLKFSIFNFQINSKAKISTIWWLIAGMELFVFISIFSASDKVLALYRYGVFLLGIGLFWLASSVAYSKVKLIYSLLAGIFIQAILGIYQFLSQSIFANKWLGVATHNPADLGVSVVETLDGARWLRAYGSLDHPNILGGVLAVGIILAIFLLIRRDNVEKFSILPLLSFKISNFKFLINFQLLILKIFLFVFLIAIFFTFSRAAWLGCLAGILTLLIILSWQKDFLALKKILIIILFLAILVGILFYQYSGLVSTRLSQDTRLEQKSSQERISSYQESWQLVKRYPFFGVGIGNYSLAVSQEVKPNQPSYYYQPVHNTFLLVLSEIGIFGVSFFVLVLFILIFNFQFSIFKKFLINKKQLLEIKNWELEIGEKFYARDLLLKLPFLIIIAVLLTFDHWLWSLHFGLLFFWLLMGILMKKD
jgi:O-antigen ligase